MFFLLSLLYIDKFIGKFDLYVFMDMGSDFKKVMFELGENID